jgi:hypothetical protein
VEIAGVGIDGPEAVAGVEFAAMVGMNKLLSIWIPTMKELQMAGKIAIPAVGAAALWALVKPWHDAEIQDSWNAWRTAAQQLQDIRFGDWDEKVKAIQAAWPAESKDRKAFDKFIKTVKLEMLQTEQAMAKTADTVQAIQTEIHQIMYQVGYTADLLLSLIIAYEIAELYDPNPIAKAIMEVMKNATAAVLMGVTATGAGIIIGVLIMHMSDIATLSSSDTGFPIAQPNRGSSSLHSNTDFKDIKVQNVPEKGWTYS